MTMCAKNISGNEAEMWAIDKVLERKTTDEIEQLIERYDEQHRFKDYMYQRADEELKMRTRKVMAR